jgi:TonB family protein
MISAHRPRSWILAISLLLHVAGIAFLLTLHSAEPLRVHSVRISLMAPLHLDPRPLTPRQSLRQPLRQPVRQSVRQPVRQPPPRTFHPPDRLEQPALPRLPLILPEPPLMQSPDTHSQEPAPPPIQLPAPPVRRAVIGAFDQPISSNPVRAQKEIKTAQFGDARAANQASRARHTTAPASSLPAEILSKPTPTYTEEARRLQIEGEVLLEVLFAATGETHVIRTIQGLGHGLDENAIAAAREIHFRPARRGDEAVDSVAVVHIVFQLAY